MAYFLYILKSLSTEKHYTFISQNPQQRLTYHNTIEKGFTSRYRPWKIVFIREYENKKIAFEAEQKIKSWKSKQMIEKLIMNENKI